MNEQELFTERLNGLMDLAEDKGGILSPGEIHFYLREVLKSEDQYEFVYRFLAEKGVRVEGWRANEEQRATGRGETGIPGLDEVTDEAEAGAEESAGEVKAFGAEEPDDKAEAKAREEDSDEEAEKADSDEDEDEDENEESNLPGNIDPSLLTADERKYLRYYQEDLAKIEPLAEKEQVTLLNALAAGDPSAMSRLTEGCLYLVLEEIPAYLHAGVAVSDLIQEGSIGLMEGIQSYRGMNFIMHLRYAIREALDAVTEEQQASDSVARHLLDAINRADAATRKLSEDLGRTPTREELAEYLHMDPDEVDTILKHSIDALTVSVSDEAYGKTDGGE